MKYAFIFALSCCAMLASVVAAPNQLERQVVLAESNPPRGFVAWPQDVIEKIVTTPSSQVDPVVLSNEHTDFANTLLFNPLKGSRIEVIFKRPHEVDQLSFVQGGSGDWATAKDIAVRLDGGSPVSVRLEDLQGKVQSVLLGCKVKRIEVTVVDTYRSAGRFEWGGFSAIGDARYIPVQWSFLEQPLQPGHNALRLQLDADSDSIANVWVELEQLRFNFPELQLKKGVHDYVLQFDELVPAEDYGFALSPWNLGGLTVESMGESRPPRLLAVEPLAEGALSDWQPLPELVFPSYTDEAGNVWREGLSYRTAGRFANSDYNGLLTETVGRSWFRAYTAHSRDIARRQDFDLQIAGESSDDTGRADELWKVQLRSQARKDGESVAVNWTTMVQERKVADGGIIRYTTGLLAPGFLVDVPSALVLSSRGRASLPIRSGAPNEDEGRFFERLRKSNSIGPVAVLTSRGLAKQGRIRSLKEPWLVAIWKIEGGVPTFWGDGYVAVLLTSDSDKTINWTPTGLELPAGRWGISTAFYGLLNEGWSTGPLQKRARLLTRMLRTYPVDAKEFYRVEESEVLVRNVFEYQRWGAPEWQAPDYAPIPPIYSWARDSVGWEGIPKGAGTESIETPVGPFRWIEGDSIQYALPRIDAKHAAYPRREQFNNFYDVMEAEIGQRLLPNTFQRETHHPWLMAYDHEWTQTLLGGGYYSAETLDKLLSAAERNIRRMYAPSSWIPRQELFSGEPYLLMGWLDMSTNPVMFGDPNSNVGQAAYSLYLYALYSGNWELVRELWPKVMDTVRVFEVLNDWAIPETTSREAVKYGAIDMDTIGYAGMVALEAMANIVGSVEDQDRLAYLRTKLSASTALRFNFPRYLDPKGAQPNLYGVGFAEDGPAIEHASANNSIGLDKIAMCFTWTGEIPEMYDFYYNTLTPEFFEVFQRDFMEVYFPDWREMEFNRVRSAAHIAARSRLPQWPRQGLKDDMAVWLAHVGVAVPPLETAGMFGAYSAHDTSVFLTNWIPAAFKGSRYDDSGRELIVVLENNEPFTLELNAPAPISSAYLDGTRIDPHSMTRDGDQHKIKLPRGGELRVQFLPLDIANGN